MALENPCGSNTDIAGAYVRLGGAYMQKLDCDGDSSVLNPSLECVELDHVGLDQESCDSSTVYI